MLAAVAAVHDVSHDVAVRVLRALQALGEVVPLDDDLHLRPGTQLTQPPAPMPVMHSAASVAAALAGVVGAFGVPPPPIGPGQQPFMPPPFPPGVFAPPPPHGAPRPW